MSLVDTSGEVMRWGVVRGRIGERDTYDKKVDLPTSESPRSKIETVGGSSILIYCRIMGTTQWMLFIGSVVVIWPVDGGCFAST